jgi:hypothetical protein
MKILNQRNFAEHGKSAQKPKKGKISAELTVRRNHGPGGKEMPKDLGTQIHEIFRALD